MPLLGNNEGKGTQIVCMFEFDCSCSDLQELEEKLLREKFRAEGREVHPRETNELSDPNVITPGTEFMEKLSMALEYYIRARLNNDPAWKGIKVW